MPSSKRSVKMRRPHRTALHRKRRAITTSRTDRPANGKSLKRRRYRLWTRSELAPHPGQGFALLMCRTVITAVAPSQTARHLKAMRDEGGWSEGLVHDVDSSVKPTRTGTHTSSKLSQSPFYTPIRGSV